MTGRVLLNTAPATNLPGQWRPEIDRSKFLIGLDRLGSMSVVAQTLVLTGCSSAPSRNILGSYFPSWMICALVGLCATIAVRGLLVKVGIDKELPMPIVVYLAFTIAFTLAMWLLWLA
jgi:hypothetical protein